VGGLSWETSQDSLLRFFSRIVELRYSLTKKSSVPVLPVRMDKLGL